MGTLIIFVLSSELLDLEFHPAEFDYVVLLNRVSFLSQASNHEPKPVVSVVFWDGSTLEFVSLGLVLVQRKERGLGALAFVELLSFFLKFYHVSNSHQGA